jgi:hypothetical protein
MIFRTASFQLAHDSAHSYARMSDRRAHDRRTDDALYARDLFAAELWGIDAFGQPAVEDGKGLTRQYLSQRRKS